MKRTLLATSVLVLIITSFALANVLTQSGTVTLSEVLTTESVDLTFDMVPNESVVRSVTVNNTGPTTITTGFVADLDPLAISAGITIANDTTFVDIPPFSSHTWDVTISASNGASPGDYTMQVSLVRP